MVELFANSGDPDQMPHSVASDLGLHCLPISLLGVSILQSPRSDSEIGSSGNIRSHIVCLTQLIRHKFQY